MSVLIMSDRALNRALLARQGLLERLQGPVVEVVEEIGAMQGQLWSALAVGLATRMRQFAPQDLYDALDRRDLHWGIGLRGTLHLVSAREHPAYSVVAGHRTDKWHRVSKSTTDGMNELRDALLEFARFQPRTTVEIQRFAETWVTDHPGRIEPAELDAQRALRWRPIYRWSALVRAPCKRRWGPIAPADHMAAPGVWDRAALPSAEQALEEVIRRHLRGFGPAAVHDIACWTGIRPAVIQQQLDRMRPDLFIAADQHGRDLFDLPQAPRPNPEGSAPAPRLLGAFDSVLLAYAVRHRQRILPQALRDVVFNRANLRIRPTFLRDGMVAGVWALERERKTVKVTLQPHAKLAGIDRRALLEEANRMVDLLHPDASTRQVIMGR